MDNIFNLIPILVFETHVRSEAKSFSVKALFKKKFCCTFFHQSRVWTSFLLTCRYLSYTYICQLLKDPHGSFLQLKAPKQQILLTSSQAIIFSVKSQKNKTFCTFLHQCQV